MKAGLTTSVAMHVVLIGAGLVSLSSPRPLESSNFESFPVEMVPLAEISQSVQGERTAPVSETPAPEPTTEEAPVDNAQNIGNNQVDLPNSATVPGNRPVDTASAPPPAEEPPAPEPVQEPAPAPEPTPPPPPQEAEAEPEPAPIEQATPEPAEEPAIAEEQPRELVQLPASAPRPQVRPQPQQQQATRPEPQREPERPAQQQRQAQQSSEESQFNEDEIAALLNRDRAQGGGAQRSTEQASLGGRQTTGAVLSQSEIDSLRSQVSRCWNPPVGAAEAENMVVSIRLKLDPSGALDGNPEIVSGRGSSMAERAAADAARRAVMRCAPFNAPADKYEAWADVQFNFDPSQMF
jgi:outer membrane biosynthesis protein TonB